jgi:pimeloyl-ACP methyl ester carboxylesterase
MTRAPIAATVALILAGCGGTATAPVSVTAAPAPILAQANPEHGTLPAYATTGNPDGPLVVVLGLSAQGTLFGTEAWDGVPSLVAAGYNVLSVDLPCHGADAPANGEDALLCWAQRLATGTYNDMFLDTCADLSAVLDHLGVDKAAIVGISRGGYAAITCAAYDARFVDVALIAPVTDLNYLWEFHALPVSESLFNVQQYIPDLSTRNVLVRIGEHDTRVDTSLALTYGRAVGATLELLNTVGHYAPESDTPINAYPAGQGNTAGWFGAHAW